MNCLNCGASSNEFGVYRGLTVIHCTKCGMDYDYVSKEVTRPSLTSLEDSAKSLRRGIPKE